MLNKLSWWCLGSTARFHYHQRILVDHAKNWTITLEIGFGTLHFQKVIFLCYFLLSELRQWALVFEEIIVLDWLKHNSSSTSQTWLGYVTKYSSINILCKIIKFNLFYFTRRELFYNSCDAVSKLYSIVNEINRIQLQRKRFPFCRYIWLVALDLFNDDTLHSGHSRPK